MRSVIIGLFIGLFTGTLSTSVIAQDADPCEKVTCSNHGNCIVKGGEPVCACDEGFIPDTTTGMSCQPVSQDNSQDTAPAAPAAPVAPVAPAKLGDGWALGASITGFAATPVFLGLGGAAVATTQEGYDNAVPIGLGGGALIVVGIMGPLVNGGSKSARRSAGVDGILGARIAAWALYGLTMANGLAEIGLAVADIPVDKWQVAVLVGTGAVSLILFSLDALISHKQAGEKIELSEQATSKFLLSPTITPVFANGQATGATIGLGGSF